MADQAASEDAAAAAVAPEHAADALAAPPGIVVSIPAEDAATGLAVASSPSPVSPVWVPPPAVASAEDGMSSSFSESKDKDGKVATADAAAPGGAGKGRGRRGAKEKLPSVPFKALFRYATGTEKLFYFVAGIAAAIQGFLFPGFTLLFGQLLNDFNSNNPATIQQAAENFGLYFLLIAIGAGICAGLSTGLPMIAAERQLKRIRHEYMRALLRQEVAYYDQHAAGELAARLIEDTITMSNGMSEKVPQAIQALVTFLSGLAVGFARSWALTLVVMALLPVIVVIMGFLAKSVATFESRLAAAYSRAGDAATEVFSSIRNVLAFGNVEHEVDRYDSHLEVAERNGSGKGVRMGAAVGTVFGLIFISYGFASLLGGQLIINDRNDNPQCVPTYTAPVPDQCFTGSRVIQTMMAVLIGSFAVGQVGPALTAVSSACAAAFKIYSLIDRKPPIDIEDQGGAKPDPKTMKGSVEFRNVTFAYPTRPTEPILTNFNLKIEGGTTVALVGESGCGKSTLLQLLQRFYDPQEGQILVDGIDVKEWNLSHLRDRIGVVSQEPLLFSSTVAVNISYGKPVSEGPATQQEIEEAAKAASAHEFITRLPQGYNTTTGTSIASTQLSGGQRQRVCIARAILRRPKLLLLDEATSALDTLSEREVQAALDKILAVDRSSGSAASSRSTIAIAHRLSTIRGYDRIVVLARGTGVIEDGTHSQLMDLGEAGIYAKLVRMQELAHGDDPDACEGHSRSRTASTAAGSSRSRSNTYNIASGHSNRGPASFGLPPAGDVVGALKTAAAMGPNLAPTVASAPNGEEDGEEGGADGLASPASPASSATAASVVPAKASAPASKDKGAASAPSKDDAKKWEEEKGRLPAVDKRRVWAIQYPERWYLAAGVVGSAISGIIQPLFSLVWSDMITIFWMSNETIYSETRRYIGYFIAIGLAQLLSTVMRIGFFVYAGEKLTRRLRTMTYRAVLRQELAFFEEERNSVGRLSSRLQADAAEVKGATGEGLSLVVQSGFAVIAGVVIAFDATWQLALVVCSIMPLMVVCALLQGRSFKGYGRGAAKALEESGHIASESTGAIKTVTAFNLQIRLLETFDQTLETPLTSGYGKAWSAGLGNAFLGFMTFAAFSLAYYAGGSFMAKGIINFKQLMRVYLAVQMSSQAAGNAINWGPDSAKADRATRSIFQLLDRQSAIDSLSTSGEIPPPNVRAKGAIEFKNVSFHYPSRPDVPALNNVSFTIKPGQKIAVVGPSGSGKSTIIQLLERFYTPTSGQILLDGKPIESYNVGWLRSQIGLISQEPVLFSDSIRYNIELGRNATPSAALVSDEERAKRYTSLGKPKWGLGAPLEAPETYKPAEEDLNAPGDVVSAAENANAAHFISQAKFRYATHCGTRGNQQLSGGQRQRLCVARVMLRDPSLVCADEATSALDSQSEKVVQAALDKILKGSAGATAAVGGEAAGAAANAAAGGHSRTSINIAHKLAAIADADCIFVLDRGTVMESGTHNQLMGKRDGLYRSLAVAQGLTGTSGAGGAGGAASSSPAK